MIRQGITVFCPVVCGQRDGGANGSGARDRLPGERLQHAGAFLHHDGRRLGQCGGVGSRQSERIDGIVATIMGLARATTFDASVSRPLFLFYQDDQVYMG